MVSKALSYYVNEEENSMDLALKFLTPSLRVQIANLQTEYQKAMQKLEKDYKIKDVLKSANLEMDEVAKGDFSNADKLSENMNKDFQNYLQDVQEAYQEYQINFLKLITLKKKLKPAERELFSQKYDGDFWQEVNLLEVEAINEFFRNTFKIGR